MLICERCARERKNGENDYKTRQKKTEEDTRWPTGVEQGSSSVKRVALVSMNGKIVQA